MKNRKPSPYAFNDRSCKHALAEIVAKLATFDIEDDQEEDAQ
jgi:hypothetical protein